jgi:ATPase subunit of ABC transporter with duplicated ATPase domains
MSRPAVQTPPARSPGNASRPTLQEVRAPGCIIFHDVVAGYEHPVMGPLSFTVRANEVVALWGPNGAGKTTALNVIGGAARVFQGRVERSEALRISHQHQNPLPVSGIPLSGRELLRLTGADPAVLPVSLQPLLKRRLSALSGGQLQLLQVWACLLAPVDLVLLDEPTNNVDQEGIAHLEAAMATARHGRSILLVSHDRRFVEAVSDRIVEVPAR